jgi:hypothetical protein
VKREAEEDWAATNVTDKTPAEAADLVDVFYADLVRPLGNLVILYARAEAALLELWWMH